MLFRYVFSDAIHLCILCIVFILDLLFYVLVHNYVLSYSLDLVHAFTTIIVLMYVLKLFSTYLFYLFVYY